MPTLCLLGLKYSISLNQLILKHFRDTNEKLESRVLQPFLIILIAV